MASTESWIKPLLRSALELFISKNDASNEFSFESDSSSKRLQITAHLAEARALTVVEGRSGRSGSDGAYALPFAGVNTSDSLRPGQVLRTRKIGFIFGDHFVPARVEICPRLLEVVERSDEAAPPSSLPLKMSQDVSIQALLQEVLRIFGQERQAVGKDRDHEAVLSQPEETSISQLAFQTQWPASRPNPAATEPTQVQSAGLLSTGEQRQKDIALKLLRPKNSNGDEPRAIGEVERRPSNEQFIRRPGLLSDENENATDDLDPSSSDISQQPLCSSHDSAPEPETPVPCSNTLSAPGYEKSPTKTVSKPSGLQRWYKHCVANRYLPRRISKIPKSQSAILDSDNSYYPPLPGRDMRPGTVPLDLLKKLIDQADHLAVNVQHRESTEPDPQREDASGEEQRRDEQEMPDESGSFNSSQSVPSEDWPDDSPKSPRRGLPPDSPSNASSHLAESEPEDSSVAEVAINEPAINEPAINEPAVNGPTVNEPAAPRLSGLQSVVSTQSEATQPRRQTICISDDSVMATSSGRQEPSSGSPAVHIKRTPHPGKAVALAESLAADRIDPEESSGPSDEVIHSTYGDQESETRVLHDKVSNAPTSTPKSSKGLRAMDATPAVKHPADNGLLDSKATKRLKISSKGRGPDSVDPDYYPVIEANRTRRSAELTSLASRKPDPQHMSCSPEAPDVSRSRKPSLAARSGTDISRRASPSDLARRSSTPLTAPSHRSNMAASPRGSSRLVTNTLFDQYGSVYQDYQGDQRSFENAVALLKRLRREGKGPHPFLFDDFIFHHYHSYRPYLVSVASSSEDPVSYGRYYDLSIQSPDHSQGVITLATLASDSSQPVAPSLEQPYVQVEHTLFPQPSQNMIRVHQSTSKHASSQHSSPPPPLLPANVDNALSKQDASEAVQQTRIDKRPKPKQLDWWNKPPTASYSSLTPRSDPSHKSQRDHSKARRETDVDVFKWHTRDISTTS
ncbi:hypothetical protein DV738_g3503, partial [Chaetothyriales sp. CBS 135597]